MSLLSNSTSAWSLNNEQRTFLADNFEDYAELALKIRTKKGTVVPFVFNKAQKYINDKLDNQLRETGKVRALILKGRQQGCSTLIGARFYHKVTHRIGYQVFILTHEAKATSKLFKIAKRYNDNVPEELRPTMGQDSTTEMSFPKIDGGYEVGTAGNKNTGRSATIQLFHGSEAAFWDNTADIKSGALQAVSNEDGTEIILESTANGQTNMFYQMCRDAMARDSEYQLIFVPWFWQDEYRTDAGEFTPNSEEIELIDKYGLSFDQLKWRRNKIKELGDDWLFKQEYPCNVLEAFQTSGDNSLIKPIVVQEARNREVMTHKEDVLVIGVDPARFGNDGSGIVWRKGRHQYKHERHVKIDTMSLVGIVHKIILEDNPDRVFIDVGGLGAGVYDRLVELGHRKIVRAVNFGGKALNEKRYKNKRAEMWGVMGEWLEDETQIEDNDNIQADLTTPQYSYDSNTRIVLERKEDIKKRGLKSPDLGDGLALTFAEPVVKRRSKPSSQEPTHFMEW